MTFYLRPGETLSGKPCDFWTGRSLICLFDSFASNEKVNGRHLSKLWQPVVAILSPSETLGPDFGCSLSTARDDLEVVCE